MVLTAIHAHDHIEIGPNLGKQPFDSNGALKESD